jgi:cupin fold WbuC family metalloprotein
MSRSDDALHSMAIEQSPEVMVAKHAVVPVSGEIVDALKARARRSPRGISRLLLHRDPNDALHQMLIVHTRGRYIRPHRNDRSAKSWHVVEGRLLVVRFSDAGAVEEETLLTAPSEGGAFIVRLSESYYHTLIALTGETAVIETILGPFTGTTYAPWAPEPDDARAADYFADLCRRTGAGAALS